LLTSAVTGHPAKLPVARLGASVAGACLIAGIAMGFVGVAAGWNDAPGAALSAGLGAATILIGSLVGVMVLWVIGRADQGAVPGAVMACTTARMIIGLGLALAVYLLAKPESRTFFGAVLAAGLLGLIVETAVLMVAVRPVRTQAELERR